MMKIAEYGLILPHFSLKSGVFKQNKASTREPPLMGEIHVFIVKRMVRHEMNILNLGLMMPILIINPL